MRIFDTENSQGFEVIQSGECLSLRNKQGHISMDKDQLLVLLALARHWAETGEPFIQSK